MGGEGSMQQMRSILKLNKELLGTRVNYFSRKHTFKSLRDSYRKAEQRIAAGPHATADELKLIRERIIREQKSRTKKIVLTMVGLLLVALFTYASLSV